MYYRMEGATLTINDYYGKTKAKIENFNNGDLGITLGGGGADNATGTSGWQPQHLGEYPIDTQHQALSLGEMKARVTQVTIQSIL